MTLQRLLDRLGISWPGWRTASGAGLLAFEVGGLIVFKRPIDKEMLPIALTLIIWESQKERHSRRSRASQKRDGDSE